MKKLLLEIHREEQREAEDERIRREFLKSLIDLRDFHYNRRLRRQRLRRLLEKLFWISALLAAWWIIVATFIKGF